jgi:hypothetical protein
MFGPIEDTLCLGGVDLDRCRNPETGDIKGWAKEVCGRLNSYAEISPSQTGAKVFFLYRKEDEEELSKLFDSKFGKAFKRAGGDHPPAIEAYIGKRWFAVTGQAVAGLETLREVSLDDLRWLINDAGPKFKGNGNDAAGGTSSRKSKSNDGSRSAKAFRRATGLKAAGMGYEAMRDALLADPDPDIAEWARTKGLAAGEREMRRIFDRAGLKGGPGCTSIEKAILAAPESEAGNILCRMAPSTKLTKAETTALINLVNERCGARPMDVRGDLKNAWAEYNKEANKQKSAKKRQTA